MRIVRVRISGWAIRRGDMWMTRLMPFTDWTKYQDMAFVFKRLSEAENWVAENS